MNFYLEKYNELTKPDGKAWCSTKVDGEGQHVAAGGFWGHCSQDCQDDFPVSIRSELSANVAVKNGEDNFDIEFLFLG